MKTFTCGKCDKPYASSQSLWNHKQRCKGRLSTTILKAPVNSTDTNARNGIKQQKRASNLIEGFRSSENEDNDNDVNHDNDCESEDNDNDAKKVEGDQVSIHDRQEIQRIITEIKKDSYYYIVTELDRKVEEWIENVKSEKLGQIEELLRSLESSKIPRSRLTELKIVLDNISGKQADLRNPWESRWNRWNR